MKLIKHLLMASIIPLVSLQAVATEADQQAQFVRGAQSWADNCMRCHNRRDPQEFTDAQWRAILLHMRIRAGFTGQETRDILYFMQKSND